MKTELLYCLEPYILISVLVNVVPSPNQVKVLHTKIIEGEKDNSNAALFETIPV